MTEPQFVIIYAVTDPWADWGENPVLLTLDWAHATRRRDRINAVRLARSYMGDIEAYRLQLREMPALPLGDRVHVEEWQVGK